MKPTDIVNDLIRRATVAEETVSLMRAQIDKDFDHCDSFISMDYIWGVTEELSRMLSNEKSKIRRSFSYVNNTPWWLHEETEYKDDKAGWKDPIAWTESSLKELDHNMGFIERLTRQMDAELIKAANVTFGFGKQEEGKA
jgi:hypothetical protein